MYKLVHLLAAVVVISSLTATYGDSGESTRVVDPNQHSQTLTGRYPYREKADYILKELDLKAGDVVVDIGAGDGWWTERMAKFVGAEGAVHASEVEQKKINKMKKKFADIPQIKPYLCPKDGTGLTENCCDLAFLSKTYHHLNDGGRVDYLRHLREVVKPNGRVCVIERHPLSSGKRKGHKWAPAPLMEQAEESGWIVVRYEMITGTHHYIAIFVQPEMFPPEPKKKK